MGPFMLLLLLVLLELCIGPPILPLTGFPCMLIPVCKLGPDVLVCIPAPFIAIGRLLSILPPMVLSMVVPIAAMGPPIRALPLSSPLSSTTGQKRSSNQHICRKTSSQRTISSFPSFVVVMFASSSTNARVASRNLLEADEVQFGMRT